MLNISNNSIKDTLKLEDLPCNTYTQLPRANRMFAWWLTVSLVLTLIIFFLPWTQNIQMKGKMTTLRPEQRPQVLHSAIAGRIEQWYVREGELVSAGDTIAFLSEVKAEYLDPDLLGRTAGQIAAKKASQNSYEQKVNALDNQIAAMRQELILKKDQLRNKIQQVKLKQESMAAALEQAKLDYKVAAFQMRRTDTLFQKGIKSLSDLEAKRLKTQETQAKLVSAQNKLQEGGNEVEITQLKLQNIDYEYNNKIAKAQSDRFSAESMGFEAAATVNKLENQYSSYDQRNKLYYILAPQSGYVTKTVVSGLGEVIKEGEKIATIVPYERELAVEMYVRPMDLPLITLDQEVRLIFDGWQAFVISGWADFSFGTYKGSIVAIDNIPNDNNNYRVLVQAREEEKPFPNLLRVGAGAQGIALLQDVPVWYELWRQLNGFPADFYQNDIEEQEAKFKPPVKSVLK
ncbi:MAG: HlyD family efflux transporter periplasmic adaptor subunit [Bacteroidota bacterium]